MVSSNVLGVRYQKLGQFKSANYTRKGLKIAKKDGVSLPTDISATSIGTANLI